MDKIKVYSSSSSKGSVDNPYTKEEYDDIIESGKEWPGGYVEGMGYVFPDVVVKGSILSDDSWFDSWFDFSDPWASSSYDGSSSSSSSEPSQGTESGNTGGNNGNSGGSKPSGNGENSNSNKGVADVMSKANFKTMSLSDDCLATCKKMLATVNCETNGVELVLMNHNAKGRPTNPTADFTKGVSYIEGQLKQGKPVIVAVDYQNGTSLKNYPNRKDQAADHFVVIVGGSLAAGFHYFDPATKSVDRGTSTNNRFTLKDGVLKSTNVCTGSTKDYTLTSLRKNK